MAALQALGEGRFALRGAVDFATTARLWRESLTLFLEPPALVIDLAGIEYANSAAAALLVAWVKAARRRRQDLHYTNMPTQLRAIVRSAMLEPLLPLAAQQS